PVVVNDGGVVARYRQARRAGARGARTIGQKDVQDLGGADAIDDLDAEPLAPPVVELLGQRLARRHAQPERGDVPALLSLFDREHRRVERRDAEEESRTMARDHFEYD